MYSKRTLRNFPPNVKKLAEAANEIELNVRRIKRVIEFLTRDENDARMLKKLDPAKLNELMKQSQMDQQLLVKAGKDLPFGEDK